jgi:hypothetical protein
MAWTLKNPGEKEALRVSDEAMELAFLLRQLLYENRLDAVESERVAVEVVMFEGGATDLRQDRLALKCDQQRGIEPDRDGNLRIDSEGATLLIDGLPASRFEWPEMVAACIDPVKQRVYQRILDSIGDIEPVFDTDPQGQTVLHSLIVGQRTTEPQEPEYLGLDESGLPSPEAETDSPSP